MSTNTLLDTNTLTQNHDCKDSEIKNDASSCEKPKGKENNITENVSYKHELEIAREVGQAQSFVSSRIFVAIPETNSETFKAFLKAYENRINGLAPELLNVRREDNKVGLSAIEGDCVFPNGREKMCFVGQIGDNAKFLIEYRKAKQLMAYISFRMFGQNSVELSRIVMDEEARGEGLGTVFVNNAILIAETMNIRLMVFPSPPLAEIENQGWIHDYQLAAAKEKLIRWYTKLGFVFCHPEYIDVIRVSDEKKTRLGICGLMAYRQAEAQGLTA